MADVEPRRSGARARSQIIFKIVTSILFGTVAFLVASGVDSGAGAEVILSIGVSVFVSGVAFMTQFLIDADKSITTLAEEVIGLREEYRIHAEATGALMKEELARIGEKFAKINSATELFGLVESWDRKTGAVTELVRNAVTIDHDDPPLLFDFAQFEIARLSTNLRGLGQHADLTYIGEDRDWLLTLTAVARHSIAATSLATVDAGGISYVGGLWDHDLGRRYLDAQRKAVQRGVHIRRIIIVDRQDMHNDAALDQVIDDQRRSGVQVRVLDPRGGIVARTSVADFIVVDDAAVYQSTATPRLDATSDPVIETTRLVTNADQVRDRANRYEELWELSTEPRSGDG